MLKKRALLVLEDGTVFQGVSAGAEGRAVGEVVFNTSMTGYQEILTDPSYAGQMVTMTYPHIGNTGTNRQDNESATLHASGLIIRENSMMPSNWRSSQSLSEYLASAGVVAISDIDTRKLTRILREKGALGGCIMTGDEVSSEVALNAARAFPGMAGTDLAIKVTTREPYVWSDGVWSLQDNSYPQMSDVDFHVVALDYGVKYNILRMLASRRCRVTVVPATTSVSEIMDMKPDGVFLSNGPGDPEACDYAIETIRELFATGLPLFGICLGYQLLALASGAKTVKMKFGHHGANHPVEDLATGKVMITSQNHGFAVNPDTLPATLKSTHRSLFDNSLQGLERTDIPAFGFQGHPEASPGPHDVSPLFDRFVAMMRKQTR